MKVINQKEIESLVQSFSEVLVGAQLQEILVNDRGLALGFYKNVTYWLILDLLPNRPGLYIFENRCPFRKGGQTKPVSLFLNSHGKNLMVSKIEVMKELGRVVYLNLANKSSSCEIEIRLIPKQANVIVRANDKVVSWAKPLPLMKALSVEIPEERTLQQIHDEWLLTEEKGKAPSQDPLVRWEQKRAKDIEKKTKALEQIRLQLESEEFQLWREAGEYIKVHQSLRLPESLQRFVDPRQSIRENLERCFGKSKQLEAKRAGAEARLRQIEEEIKALEESTYQSSKSASSHLEISKKVDFRGRKIKLPSGAIAYCGKSAADNLSLLRKAKSWDYWIHLKDYPGAHGIIHRQREQNIADSELILVASWVARESFSGKHLDEGQKILAVVVECRFVRPIKGDKLGRVTFHSERNLVFSLRQN